MSSTNDRFIDELEDYLDGFDGETPLPVHVRDSLRAQLPGTRQIRSGPGPRRMLTMVSELSTPARVGLVAAGLVVAVGLGAGALANQPGPNVAAPPPSASALPTATPLPTTAPTVAPSASGLVPSIASLNRVPCKEGAESFDTCLPAGTYQFSSGDLPDQVFVDLPAGWWYWDPGLGMEGVLVGGYGADAPDGSGWGIVLSSVGQVRRDPCDSGAGDFAAGEVDTPEELAAAMATWPGFQSTEPQAFTLAGASGVLLELSATEDVGECAAGTILWTTARAMPYEAYPMGGAGPASRAGTFRILDIDGELLVIRSTEFRDPSPHELSQGVEADPDRHAGDLAGMASIIDSLQFGERAP